MTSWTFTVSTYSQSGTLTRSSAGAWSYTPTDGDVPDNEYISHNATTGIVTWYQVIPNYATYARYTWPDTISSGDIVAADGTAATGFTHNWGHSSLGTGHVTIIENSSGGGGGEVSSPAEGVTATQKKVFCNFW